MSPHGIAGPQNQSSPNSGKKCPSARPLIVQNFVAIRQEVSEISAIENLCSPQKRGQNSPKSLKICYPLKPHYAKFHRDQWNHFGEKRYNFFYTLQYFGSPGGPAGPYVTGLGGGVHQPNSSYLQIFVPFGRPLSDISAAKLRRFCCRCDPQKTYDKRHVSTLNACGDNKYKLQFLQFQDKR